MCSAHRLRAQVKVRMMRERQDLPYLGGQEQLNLGDEKRVVKAQHHLTHAGSRQMI
jgi:hypothetical protein